MRASNCNVHKVSFWGDEDILELLINSGVGCTM